MTELDEAQVARIKEMDVRELLAYCVNSLGMNDEWYCLYADVIQERHEELKSESIR